MKINHILNLKQVAKNKKLIMKKNLHILNLYYINNYCFIVTDNNDWLHKINIINDKLICQNDIVFKEKIIDCLVLNNNLIIFSFFNYTKIFDINPSYQSFIKKTSLSKSLTIYKILNYLNGVMIYL